MGKVIILWLWRDLDGQQIIEFLFYMMSEYIDFTWQIWSSQTPEHALLVRYTEQSYYGTLYSYLVISHSRGLHYRVLVLRTIYLYLVTSSRSFHSCFPAYLLRFHYRSCSSHLAIHAVATSHIRLLWHRTLYLYKRSLVVLVILSVDSLLTWSVWSVAAIVLLRLSSYRLSFNRLWAPHKP